MHAHWLQRVRRRWRQFQRELVSREMWSRGRRGREQCRRDLRLGIEFLEERQVMAVFSWSGDIPDGTVWHAGDIQKLTGTVRVPTGSHLTIEPGSVVKMTYGDTNLVVDGTLVARGTSSQPIVVTSLSDDSAGGDTDSNGATNGTLGDWGEVRINAGSTANELEYVDVRYGGGWGSVSELSVAGPVTITNSTLRHSYTAGVRVEGVAPLITNTHFHDNRGAAVSMDLAANPGLTGVTLANNGINGAALDGGTLPTDNAWNDPEIPYWVSANITVPAGRKLTVAAGQIIKFNYGDNNLVVNGTLETQGTADAPVTFTSYRDDSVGGNTNNDGGVTDGGRGDWGEIQLSDTSTANVLRHTKVRFGGGWGSVAEVFAAGELTMADSTIEQSNSSGMRLEGSAPTLSRNTWRQNRDAAIVMDLAASPAITGVTVANNGTNAVRLDGGELPTNNQWNDPDIVYWLGGNITVPAGRTLTVGAGQVIKVPYGDYNLLVDGTLRSEGTAVAPVVITSYRDDSVGGDTNNDGSTGGGRGDWGEVRLNAGSQANSFAYTDIRFGGSWGSFGALVSAGPLTASHCTFQDSHSAGVRLEGSDATFSDTTWKNNSGAAVSMDVAASPTITGVVVDQNGVNGVVVDGGALPGDRRWDDPDIVYWVGANITVPAGKTLVVDAGQVVKFPYGDVNLFVDGTLRSEGTSAAPVVFTSYRDDTVGGDTNRDGNTTGGRGDWGEIRLNAASQANVLNHTEIRFGGGWGSAGELFSAGPLTMTDSQIRQSYTAGIRLEGSAPTLTNTTWTDNAGAAVSANVDASPAITGVTLQRNGVNGVVLDGGVLATDHRWDDRDIVYFVSQNITVPQGITLTVGSGQVVKFAYGDVNLFVDGTLVASGTADAPAVFTSYRDDTVGGDTNNDGNTTGGRGDWGEVRLNATSSANDLRHAELRFGGGWGSVALLHAAAPLTLADSQIQHSYTNGIRLEQNDATLTNVVWNNNAGAAVSMNLAARPNITGVTVTNNGINGAALDGGTIPTDQRWDDPDMVYWITSNVTVPPGVTLAVAAGQVVKFDYGDRNLWVEGSLRSEGTPAAPVIFTSYRDDTAGGDTNRDGVTTGGRGDWGEIRVRDASGGSVLDSTEVRFGGGWGSSGNVVVDSGKLEVVNSLVRESYTSGVQAQAAAVVVVSNSVFVANSEAGVLAQGAADVQLTNNTITSNRRGVILTGRGTTGVLTNNLITHHVVGGLNVSERATVVLQNNDLFNPGTSEGNYQGTPDATGTDGNLSVDPQYVNRSSLDLHLSAGSPVIDAGVGTAVPTEDREYRWRVDDPAVPNTGSGAVTFVDLGAYERGDRFRQIRHWPTGETAEFVEQILLTFRIPMDTTSFSPNADVVEFRGPNGAIPVSAFRWRNPYQLEIQFPVQRQAGNYRLLLGSQVLDANGQSVDQDGDGLQAEPADDRYEATFEIVPPRVAAQSPLGFVGGTTDHLTVTFDRPMNPNTLTVDTGIASFRGPAGPLTVTRVEWTDPRTANLSFTPQTALGAYELTLASTVADAGGNLLDTDGDKLGGESQADQYVASWTLADLIHVAGEIRTDTTWGGLVLVDDNTTVLAGVTLTLQPGTIVKFADATALTIQATAKLVADGTSAQPIRLTSQHDDSVGGDSDANGDRIRPLAGDWRGIFVDGGQATLDHAVFTYGGGTANGQWNDYAGSIVVHSDGVADVTNSSIIDSYFEGVLTWGRGSRANLTSSLIANADRGVNADGTVKLLNCTIDNSRIGIWGHGGSYELVNSIISRSFEAGIDHVLGTTATIRYSNVHSTTGVNYKRFADQTGVSGNLSVDPRYHDPDQLDYRLRQLSPMIDAADGSVAPATDQAGAPRYDDPLSPNSGIITATQAFADLGAIEYVEGASSAVDLVVTQSSGPVTATAGTSAQAQWTVRNQGTEVARGAWLDRVYLSTDLSWSADDVLVATVLHEGDLGPAQSYQGNADFLVPGIFPGSYHVIVRANADQAVFEGLHITNNATAALGTTALHVPVLTVGGSVSGTLTADAKQQLFQIDVPVGQDVEVLVEGPSADAGVEVYSRRGDMPSQQSYDNRSTAMRPGVLLSGAQGGLNFVLVRANTVLSPLALTLRATARAFALDRATPATASNLGTTTFSLVGAQFAAGATVELVDHGGVVVAASQTKVVDSGLILASFDLRGRAEGAATLRVKDPSGASRSLADGVVINHAALGELKTHLVLPSRVRAGRPFEITVEYENTGGTDILAPVLELAGTGIAKVGISREVPGHVASVLLLGPNSEAPLGSLPPGASGRLTLYGSTTAAGTANYSLNTGSLGSQAVPWQDWKAGMRPAGLTDAAWELLFARVVNDLGATWDVFHRALATGIERIPRDAGNRFVFQDVLRFLVGQAREVLGTTVSGRLTPARNGDSVASLDLRLVATDGTRVLTALTDATGQFQFLEVPTGQYRLEVDGAFLTATPTAVVASTNIDLGQIVVEPGGTVSGQVLRAADAAPVVGADVIAASTAGQVFHLLSDSTGHYQFTGLPSGDYSLRASGPGLAPSDFVSLVIVNRTIMSNQNLLVADQATISGRLTGLQLPVPAGAIVMAADADGRAVNQVTPNADGSFSLDRIPAGTLTVVAVVPGYVLAESEPIQVAAGQLVSNLSVALRTGGGLRGRYVVSGTNAPLANVMIEVEHLSGGVRYVPTDSEGRFETSDLPAGQYELRGIAGETYRTAAVSAAVVAGTMTDVNLTALPAGLISGVVRDASGRVLTNAIVTAVGANGERSSIATRADGTYTLRNLPAGTYSVLLGDADGVGLIKQTVTIPAGSLTATADFVVPKMARINGFVLAADGSTPIANVLVSLARNGSPVAIAISDAAGRVSFQVLQTANYVLTAAGDVYFAPQVVTITAGTIAEEVRIVAGAAQRVGYVHDAVTNSPRAGAVVEIYQQIPDGESELIDVLLTDAVGNFPLAGLGAGTYELVAWSDNRGFAIGTLVIGDEEGEPSPVVLSMGVSTAIEGTVLNSDTGQPIAGARVQLAPVGRRDFLTSATTGTDGKYRLSGLAVGQYDVVMSSAGREQVQTSSVGTSASSAATVDSTLPPAGAPTTFQYLSHDEPLAGAQFEARDAAGRVRATGTTDANGQGRILGVPGFVNVILMDGGGDVTAPLADPTQSEPIGVQPSALDDLAAIGDKLSALGYFPADVLEWFLKRTHEIEKDPDHPGEIQSPIACPNYYAQAQRMKRFADSEFKSWEEAQWDYSNALAKAEAVGKVTIAITKVAGLLTPFIASLKKVPGNVSTLRRLLKSQGTTYADHKKRIEAWNEMIKLEQDVVQVIGDTRNAASSMSTLINVLRSPVPPAGSQEEIDRNLQIDGALNDFYALTNSSSKMLGRFSTRVKAILDLVESTPFLAEIKSSLDFLSGVADAALAIREAYNDAPELWKKEANAQQRYDLRRKEYRAAIQRAKQAMYLYLDCESQAASGVPITDFVRPPVKPGPGGSTQSGTGVDPNDKTGPRGAGGFIGLITMPYLVQYENDPNLGATLAVQEVVVSDALDADLDLDTFEFHSFGFNNRNFDVPPGLRHYETTVDLRPEGINLLVPVTLDVDPQTRLLTAKFGSLDPITLDFPSDIEVGFLPVNDKTLHNGEGYFSYSVRPKSDAPSGTEILNQASIVFDINAPILTPQTRHVLDLQGPTSQVAALPANSNTSFTVQWSGSDSESGVATYDVFVSDNGGEFILWQDDSTVTSESFTGTIGHTYRFYSVATDRVGLVESVPANADATTLVVDKPWTNARNSRDVTNDNFVVPQDVLVVINEINGRNFSDPVTGLLKPRPGDARFYYDVNGDGFCAPVDALIIINFLNAAAGEGETSLVVPPFVVPPSGGHSSAVAARHGSAGASPFVVPPSGGTDSHAALCQPASEPTWERDAVDGAFGELGELDLGATDEVLSTLPFDTP